MEINLIAAIDENHCIGNNNQLLYKDKQEMKFFTETTKNSIVVMGRKTWESLPPKYRPLPNRLNVVLSSSTDIEFNVKDTTSVQYKDLNELMGHLTNNLSKEIIFTGYDKCFIIGGADIYYEMINFQQRHIDKIYLSKFKSDKIKLKSGNKYFPNFNLNKFINLFKTNPDLNFDTYIYINKFKYLIPKNHIENLQSEIELEYNSIKKQIFKDICLIDELGLDRELVTDFLENECSMEKINNTFKENLDKLDLEIYNKTKTFNKMKQQILSILVQMGYTNPILDESRNHISFSSYGSDNFKQEDKDKIKSIMGDNFSGFHYGHDTQYILFTEDELSTLVCLDYED